MNVTRFGGWLAALLLSTFAVASDAAAQTADLSITATLIDPAIPPAAGISVDSDIVYTIEVTNLGPSPAEVEVDDFISFGVSFVSNAGDCVTSFPCNLGTMAVSETKTITTTFHVPDTYDPPTAIGHLANVYPLDATDPNDLNDEVYVVAPVNGRNCGNFKVSGGTAHTCSVVAGNGKTPPNNVDDDLVECWGDNFSDQSLAPAGTFSEVSAGAYHTCGLRPSGAVECWGSTIPDWGVFYGNAVPGDTDFVQIDSGYDFSCGVHSDNTIECWGDDSFVAATPPAEIYTQVAAGYVHACGLTSSQTIVCWGFDSDDLDFPGDPIVTGVPPHTDFIQVVANNEHVCGLRENGSVDCWGYDYDGETADAAGPYVAITAGDEHNCGLKADSTVECWGSNLSGQLVVPGDALTGIDAGAFHTCGLLSDGTILCWGDDSSLQSTPPARSDKCPTCGDGLIEGRETCEACLTEFCDIGSCNESNTPPDPNVCNTELDICCSPVTCTAYRLSENHVCRPGTGGCDAPEVCNGVNFDSCPAPGGLRPNGFVCRLALGGCDPAETCDGISDACPTDSGTLAIGTPCRAAAGSCDVVETCDGTSPACPADAYEIASTLCRGAAGFCDLDEVCSGTDPSCPLDARKSNATLCRGSTEICDAEEFCSGGVDCPADGYLGIATLCRGAVDICDAEERCSGGSPACPADGMRPINTPCRASAGGCDILETCTGTSNACPADTFRSAGFTCRSANGVCDVAETCAGGTAACPADAVRDTSFTCRGAADACDVDENCDGAGKTCPANAFATAGSPCSDGAFCNGDDTCDGSGSCLQHAGDPCPGPNGDGNCSQSCDEAADACTADDPDASPCDDSDVCTSGETCTAGTCAGGEPTDCNDGNLCTDDSCDPIDGCVNAPAPRETGCYLPGKFTFAIKDTGFAEKNKFKWGWKKGEPVDPADLGSPLETTTYALCIFDRSGDVPALVGSYVVPASPELWIHKKPEIAAYKDKPGTADGVTGVKLKAGDEAGKSLVNVKAGGLGMQLPDPASTEQFFAMDPALTIQLVNDVGGCWTSDFLPEQAKKNTAINFKAVGP